MKVGVITIHNHFNYGAVLQAYAMSRAIRRLGHESTVIDCRIEPGKGRSFSRSKHPGEQLKNLYLAWHRAEHQRFIQRFTDFIREEIPLTEASYSSLEQLLLSPPSFDAYVTGSDQVWNPALLDRRIGDAFHLCFADPASSRLIAYAPSFGTRDLPERHREKVARYLMRYHFLSVREQRGQELVRELTGRRAEQVLDPTLLLTAEEYAPLARCPAQTPRYLLVYPMEMGDGALMRLTSEVKRSLSLPVVAVLPLDFHHRWLKVADAVVLDAGPGEFLGLMQNASFVCTNSFHGTAFSIIFRKNFLSVPHSTSNARIAGLLGAAGLTSRQLSEVGDGAVRDALSHEIDYREVLPRLNERIEHSLSYLAEALRHDKRR